MQPRVQNNKEASEPFPVINGIKQGCVMAPTLFSIMFSAMVIEDFRDSYPGLDITYHTDVTCSISGVLKVKSDIILMPVPLTLAQKQIHRPLRALTMDSLSVQRQQKLCTRWLHTKTT